MSLKDIVRNGEKKIYERIKILRMADKVGWLAVDKYVTDLCVNDEDDLK